MKIKKISLKYFKMIITIIYFLLLFSCENNQNKNDYKEFIFAQIKGVKIDSLGHPRFRLVAYLELDSLDTQKFAYSSSDGENNKLDCFGTFTKSSFNMADTINKYLKDFKNDSVNELNRYIKAYLIKDSNSYESMSYIYAYIVSFRTQDNKSNDFYFCEPTFAIKQIENSINYIKKINKFQNVSFKINNKYNYIEERLFEIALPPPPPPLTNEAKFVRPN
jgi:hypothetical protein